MWRKKYFAEIIRLPPIFGYRFLKNQNITRLLYFFFLLFQYETRIPNSSNSFSYTYFISNLFHFQTNLTLIFRNFKISHNHLVSNTISSHIFHLESISIFKSLFSRLLRLVSNFVSRSSSRGKSYSFLFKTSRVHSSND